jgi:hypothetical protein
MAYAITSSLHSSPTASLSPAAPPVLCSSHCRFNVWTALASFSQSLSTPLLSFFHSDPARQQLPPPIAPHPEVELIEPASVASPHAGLWDAILVCDPLWTLEHQHHRNQKPKAWAWPWAEAHGLAISCTCGIIMHLKRWMIIPPFRFSTRRTALFCWAYSDIYEYSIVYSMVYSVVHYLYIPGIQTHLWRNEIPQNERKGEQ